MGSVSGRMTKETVDRAVLEASKSADLPESQDSSILALPTNTLKDDIKYYMGHKRRGHAYLFDHENNTPIKPQPHMPPSAWKGSQINVKNMKKALTFLGFKVKIIKNASYSTLTAEIAQLSKMDHADCDCVLVAVFAPGGSNVLYASDQRYQPEILWEPFLPQNCPSLAGKPKLFFIQAYQKKLVDSGTLPPETGASAAKSGGNPKVDEVDESTTSATESRLSPYSIPSHADFLISCSMVPGFLSFPDEVVSANYWTFTLFGAYLFVPHWSFSSLWLFWPLRYQALTAPGSGNNASEDTVQAGSWFVETLAQVLQECPPKDLLSVLVIVSYRVATRLQSCTDDKALNEKMQNTCFHSTLIRKVFFEPKTTA